MAKLRFDDGRMVDVSAEQVQQARQQLAALGLGEDNRALGAFLNAGLDPAYQQKVLRGAGRGRVPPQLAYAVGLHLGEGQMGPRAPGMSQAMTPGVDALSGNVPQHPAMGLMQQARMQG